MLAKEVLPQFQFGLIQTDRATVAAQQPGATFAANPIAQIIAQNGATGSRYDHLRKRESVARPSIDDWDEQHCLARKGNAHTLDSHKEQHRPVGVGHQPMRQLGCGKMKHLSFAFPISPPNIYYPCCRPASTGTCCC